MVEASVSRGSALGPSIGTSEIEAGAVTPVKMGGAVNQSVKVNMLLLTAINGAWGLTMNSNHADNTQINAPGPAIDNQVDFYVNLPSGTYSCIVHGQKDSSYGIATLKIDDVAVGTQDWYAAGSTVTSQTTANIAVATSGIKKLSVVMASKNASSSGYGIILSAIYFKKTA